MKDFRIVKYQDNQSTIEVRFSLEENTVWLTQKEMAILLVTNNKNISFHLNKILQKDAENAPTGNKMLLVQTEGKRGINRQIKVYNMDAIKELGHRIKATNLQPFLRWVDETFENLKNQVIIEESNIIRFESNDVSLDVKVSPTEDTVYLTKDQLSILFKVSKQNIEYHIAKIYDAKELDECLTCKEILQVQNDGVC